MKTAHPWRGTARQATSALIALLLAVAGLAVLSSPQATAAGLGGPVILGGDDLTDHGSYDGGTQTNQVGWLYIEKAIANIKPQVARPGANGSIAALGSADPSFDPANSYSGDAGASIASAGVKNSMPVNYFPDDAAINGFFDALRAGTAKPSIIWIAGDGASNDLGSNGGAAALTSNAATIGDFVNSGGGLMSHGTEYGWLGGVLPGVSMGCGGNSDDLVLTPEGQAAFPGLTDPDVNSGPWHGCFEGDIGGLGVLVESTQIKDTANRNARVIIGGAAVTLPGSLTLTPASAKNPVGTSHTVTATVRNTDGTPKSGATVSFSVTSGPGKGAAGNRVTNASGKATFTWTNNGTPGTDTVQASFTNGGTTFTDTATKTWEGATATPKGPIVAGRGTTKCPQTSYARAKCDSAFYFYLRKVGNDVRGSIVLNNYKGRFDATRRKKGRTLRFLSSHEAVFKARAVWSKRGRPLIIARVYDGAPDRVLFRIFLRGKLIARVEGVVRSGDVKVIR